jgi:hypothetical protein
MKNSHLSIGCLACSEKQTPVMQGNVGKSKSDVTLWANWNMFEWDGQNQVGTSHWVREWLLVALICV